MTDSHDLNGDALLPADLDLTLRTASTMSLGRAESLGFGLQRGQSVGLTGLGRADSIKFFESDNFNGPLDNLSEETLNASTLFASAQSVGISKEFRPDMVDLMKLTEMEVQPISPETTVGDSPVTGMQEDDGSGAAPGASASRAAKAGAEAAVPCVKATTSVAAAGYVHPIMAPVPRTTPASPTLPSPAPTAVPALPVTRSPVPAATYVRPKREAAKHHAEVSQDEDSDEDATGEPLKGQSSDIIDANGHFLRLEASLTAQNIGQKGGIATIAAGRQGQQLKLKVSLQATQGTVLQEDVDLEAMLLGPDKKPLDVICLDDEMVPALQQWQKAYMRNANKDQRPMVTVPKSQPTGWSKQIALRVLVLSSQLSNAPVKLCLRPTDSRFSQLQVLLPPMYCMSVPRTKRDRSRRDRPARHTVAEVPPPSASPDEERPRARRRTSAGSSTAAVEPGRATVYQPAEIALVKPAIGPAKPHRPEILVRLRGVGKLPFKLFLVQRSNQRTAEAEPIGEVRMADDMLAECRFRLPQLDSYNYALEAEYGEGKTVVRGGLSSGSGRYGACTVSIARPANGDRIVGLHAGFVFSAQPFSCFENRGFRLYLSDGRVIDTDQNLDGQRGSVHFAEHGEFTAVAEVVDELCGAARFEIADRMLAPAGAGAGAAADREPPRLKTYYMTGTEGEYCVELTDGRRFTTTADIRGFATLEPVRPASASYPQPQTRTYGITSQRVMFRLVDEAETREQQAASENLRRFMDILNQSGANPMSLLSALTGGASGASTPSLSSSGGSSNSIGAPYSACAAALAQFAATPACRAAAARLRKVAEGARAAGPAAARALAAARDSDGNSPLHYAAGVGAGDLCAVLLDASAADPYARNRAGLTAMHIAALIKSAPALDAFYDRRVDLTVRAVAAGQPLPCWGGRTVQECWPEYYDEGRANACMRPVIYVPPLVDSDEEMASDGSPASSDCEDEDMEDEEEEEEGLDEQTARAGPYASLLNMPDDLVMQSLARFDAGELGRFGAVCRRFRRLAKQAAAVREPPICGIPDELLARIFGQTGLTSFDLGPVRLVCRRFNAIITKDDGTAVLGMPESRVRAAASSYFRLYREPVMAGEKIDAAEAFNFLQRELFANRVWESPEHAAQGRAWSSFAGEVARLARERVLAALAPDVAACRRTAADAEEEAAKAAGREELVLRRTPAMVASLEAAWARVSEGRPEVDWPAVARAAYRLFAPLPATDRDLDNARAIVQERLANPALLPRGAAPVHLDRPINREAFVKTWPWFFFAHGALTRTAALWREAAEHGAAGAAPSALRHAFVSRYDAEQELVRSQRAGTYMLRLSSLLWPDPDTGALAVSVLSRDPSAPPAPPGTIEPPLVQHELLPPRDYESGEAVIRHLTEIPQVFQQALAAQQEMASYIRFDHQYIIPDYRRRPHAASTADFRAAPVEVEHVKPVIVAGPQGPAAPPPVPEMQQLTLSEGAGPAGLIGQMKAPPEARYLQRSPAAPSSRHP